MIGILKRMELIFQVTRRIVEITPKYRLALSGSGINLVISFLSAKLSFI